MGMQADRKETRRLESPLLDQCMIVYGSGISDGNKHWHNNLPILLAAILKLTKRRWVAESGQTPQSAGPDTDDQPVYGPVAADGSERRAGRRQHQRS